MIKITSHTFDSKIFGNPGPQISKFKIRLPGLRGGVKEHPRFCIRFFYTASSFSFASTFLPPPPSLTHHTHTHTSFRLFIHIHISIGVTCIYLLLTFPFFPSPRPSLHPARTKKNDQNCCSYTWYHCVHRLCRHESSIQHRHSSRRWIWHW